MNVPADGVFGSPCCSGQGSEFAFVVFGAAQMANVLDPEWRKR